LKIFLFSVITFYILLASFTATAETILFIGDSVMAGIPKYYIRQKFNMYSSILIDTKVCRKMTTPGCFHGKPESALNVLSKYDADTIVIMIGHNDERNKSFTHKIKLLMDRIEGNKVVYWLTMREVSNTYRNANAILKSEAKNNKKIRILDWAYFSRNETSWFTKDGTHLNKNGGKKMANFILETL
jgi:UDP-glucose 6-dehydrogenase